MYDAKQRFLSRELDHVSQAISIQESSGGISTAVLPPISPLPFLFSSHLLKPTFFPKAHSAPVVCYGALTTAVVLALPPLTVHGERCAVPRPADCRGGDLVAVLGGCRMVGRTRKAQPARVAAAARRRHHGRILVQLPAPKLYDAAAQDGASRHRGAVAPPGKRAGCVSWSSAALTKSTPHCSLCLFRSAARVGGVGRVRLRARPGLCRASRRGHFCSAGGVASADGRDGRHARPGDGCQGGRPANGDQAGRQGPRGRPRRSRRAAPCASVGSPRVCPA